MSGLPAEFNILSQRSNISLNSPGKKGNVKILCSYKVYVKSIKVEDVTVRRGVYNRGRKTKQKNMFHGPYYLNIYIKNTIKKHLAKK